MDKELIDLVNSFEDSEDFIITVEGGEKVAEESIQTV